MREIKKIKKGYFLLSLLCLCIQRIELCASHKEQQQEAPQRMSLCPNDLSPMINKSKPTEEHHLFQQWQTMVHNLAPILHEGGRPSVFISHAWHMNNKGPVDQDSTREDALYYDQIDLQLATILKSAGFDVHYDKDYTKPDGIVDEGATPFMEKKVRESDIIIGVCTPLYHTRSTLVTPWGPTGVKIEVDRIKERLRDSPTIGFYIPLLVHASDKDYPWNKLLVGTDLERMNQVIFLDGRDKFTFISNMWRLFHRMWKNVKLKWENNPSYDPQASPLNQRYIKALGDLLESEDYYDSAGKPIPSGIKEGLKSAYSNLRVLTTISQDLNASTIATLIKQEIDTHKDLLSASTNKDIVAFLGNTGTGKSTLINFLAGRELRADEDGQGYELANPEDPTAMKVGTGADSETIYPQWIQVDEMLYFDLPGFNDTCGSIRDLVNAAFIRQILIGANSVRFVFVAGQDEITVHRSKIVKKLFNGVKAAFKSPEIIENNSMLIVTKSAFHDCSKAINFWFKKMRSAHGTELQDQLKTWNTHDRLFHMPYSSFNEAADQQLPIRTSMLNGLNKMKPANHEDVKHFNVSGFFPPEINMPLQTMFVHVIQEQSQEDINEWDSLKKFIDACWVSTEDITQKNEYAARIAHYRSDVLWETFWKKVNEHLSTEMSLLKEVCQDPYEQACLSFQKRYESKRQEHLEKYRQCLTMQPKAEQLVQRGYNDPLSWRIAQLLVQQGHDEKESERRIELLLAQKEPYFDEIVFLRFLNGKLVYQPKKDSDEGKIEMKISDLEHPLACEFDLSMCGDTGEKISISTGYRKGKRAANKEKIEVWIVPKFVVEKELSTVRTGCIMSLLKKTGAEHYRSIMDDWSSQLAIFWADGSAELVYFDYLTNKQFDEISSKNLYECAPRAVASCLPPTLPGGVPWRTFSFIFN